MATRISTPELLERCAKHGFRDAALARQSLHATLATLASRLTGDEANALSSTLTGELSQIVDQSEYDSDFDAAELYLRVAQRTNNALGVAHEQADVVLRALGEAIDEDVRKRLCRVLPEPIARQLQGPEHGEPPPHPITRKSDPPISSLAAGRPGSKHPLSESVPSQGQTHSIARNDEPHAETKLSTSRGLTQERFGETLAEGEGPRTNRPLSEATDD